MSWFRRKSRRREKSAPPPPIKLPEAKPVDIEQIAPVDEALAAQPAVTEASAAEIRQAEFALAEGIVTRDILRQEIRRAGAESTPLGRALLGLGYPDLADIARILGRITVPRIDLDRIGPSEEALRRLPAETARARDCLPLDVFGNIICVAMARPEDLSGIREIRDVTGLRVKALRSEGSVVRTLIERYYPSRLHRPFLLRPLPVSDETYTRAHGRNRIANDLASEWERVWLHGEPLAAEAATDEN